ncbi:MAG: serine/threonine-protein kinase [Kofleriaceae bacterium]
MANSPKRVTVDVGSVIADTYTIEALIGEGGMGQVFLASHLRLPGKQVAIKLLHGGLEDADILRRFAREAEIASRLGHPNIVGVVDTNLLSDGTPYLVLEYLQGESLSQRLKRGPLTLNHVLSLIRQIGSALAAAHREGIVHRDLKPQNIFLCPTEVDGRLVEIAKVLDFGISKMRGSDTVKTQESTLLGTPQYMAPEQATGQHSTVDERTDIFALGAILYEMFTGHPAFAGASIPEVVFKVVYEHPTPLAQIAPELPAQVVAAVTRAMAKPAEERFASVSELVEALTGTPLATLTSPPGTRAAFALTEGATYPPVSARGEDAFASTMHSGNLAHAPVIPITPHSATLRSLDSAPGSTRPPMFTSSIREPSVRDQRVIETVAQTVPTPRRSRVALLATAVGALAVAGIVVLVVMRDDRPAAAPPVDAARLAEVAPVDATSIAPDATSVIALDAGIVVDARPDARPRSSDAGVKSEVRPIEPEAPEDATLGQTLRKAEAALATDPQQAKMIANQIVDAGDPEASPRASRRQLARAHAVRGAAACKTADLGDAKSDLAALNRLRRGNPALATFRAKMLASCHADQQLLNVK